MEGIKLKKKQLMNDKLMERKKLKNTFTKEKYIKTRKVKTKGKEKSRHIYRRNREKDTSEG